MKPIIGVANSWHDPAICVVNGAQVFAEALERPSQCKRAIGMNQLWYSSRSLARAFERLGLRAARTLDVTTIAGWDMNELEKTYERSGYSRTDVHRDAQTNPMSALLLTFLETESITRRQLELALRNLPASIDTSLCAFLTEAADISWNAKHIHHHLAHAANAAYTSPFSECLILVIDGYGDNNAISIYRFRDNTFELIHQADFRFSLGLLYSRITGLCGFSMWDGEEWKVMGLAGYGAYRDTLYRFFRKRMRVEGLDVTLLFDVSSFDHPTWRELEGLCGGFRRFGDEDVLRAADLAHNFQLAFEDTIIELVQSMSNLCLSKNLALAGGCALNSSCNGKIIERSGFESLHVPSAPGDDGNCLGAALYEKYCLRGEPRTPEVMTPYLGSEMNLSKLEQILTFGKLECETHPDDQSLCRSVARALAEGHVIGWVQGRAEFGPRALGNRSILADPRSRDAKKHINGTVKFREFYRPIAPAVLHERAHEFFQDYQQSPYMERTLRFRPSAMDVVPAVVHQDGTGRLQTVTEESNSLLYRLLREFDSLTGVPVLVNTSLNVMGKPIVHSVEDAITEFFTTGLDALVIGNHVITSPGGRVGRRRSSS